MQNFSSFISYTGFLTPFKVKTWFFYSINARYYLWEENNNAKMSRSIKILDVPKTFQFSFFFTPVCVYFQKISMARNAIFFLFKCWILKLCASKSFITNSFCVNSCFYCLRRLYLKPDYPGDKAYTAAIADIVDYVSFVRQRFQRYGKSQMAGTHWRLFSNAKHPRG